MYTYTCALKAIIVVHCMITISIIKLTFSLELKVYPNLHVDLRFEYLKIIIINNSVMFNHQCLNQGNDELLHT